MESPLEPLQTEAGTVSRRTPRRSFKNDETGSAEVRTIAIGTILIVVSLVVALTVLPTLTSSVADAQADANVTATQSTLLGLIPTLVIVGLVVAGVGFLFKGLRGISNKS